MKVKNMNRFEQEYQKELRKRLNYIKTQERMKRDKIYENFSTPVINKKRK